MGEPSYSDGLLAPANLTRPVSDRRPLNAAPGGSRAIGGHFGGLGERTSRGIALASMD